MRSSPSRLATWVDAFASLILLFGWNFLPPMVLRLFASFFFRQTICILGEVRIFVSLLRAYERSCWRCCVLYVAFFVRVIFFVWSFYAGVSFFFSPFPCDDIVQVCVKKKKQSLRGCATRRRVREAGVSWHQPRRHQCKLPQVSHLRHTLTVTPNTSRTPKLLCRWCPRSEAIEVPPGLPLTQIVFSRLLSKRSRR